MIIEEAKEILGKNIFTVDNYWKYFGILLKKEDLCGYQILPWVRSDLLKPSLFDGNKTIGQTHFAFWGIDKYYLGECNNILPLKMDVKSILDKYRTIGKNVFTAEELEQDFFLQKTAAWPFWGSWHMVPISIIPDYLGINFSEQKKKFSGEYKQTDIAVQLMAFTLMSKLKLIEEDFSWSFRTIDRSLAGEQISITFSKDSVWIDTVKDDEKHIQLSLAVEREYFR